MALLLSLQKGDMHDIVADAHISVQNGSGYFIKPVNAWSGDGRQVYMGCVARDLL